MKEFHRPRIEYLLSENVDFLAIETLPAQVCMYAAMPFELSSVLSLSKYL